MRLATKILILIVILAISLELTDGKKRKGTLFLKKNITLCDTY